MGQLVEGGVPTRTRSGRSVVILAFIAIVLLLTTVVFYSEYQNQLSINSQQSKLENGIPTKAVDDCFANPKTWPDFSDWVPLVPENLRNLTIAGWGLVRLLPSPLNSTSFILFMVYRVSLFPTNKPLWTQPVSTFPYVDMVHMVNCSLAG